MGRSRDTEESSEQRDAFCQLTESRDMQCVDYQSREMQCVDHQRAEMQRAWICAGVSGLVVVGTGQVTRCPAGTQERAEPGSRWSPAAPDTPGPDPHM